MSREDSSEDIDCDNFSSDKSTELRTELSREAVVQWLGRSLITRPARAQFPGWEARIIRCKNLALHIRDCESLCLSDETLKAFGSFYESI